MTSGRIRPPFGGQSPVLRKSNTFPPIPRNRAYVAGRCHGVTSLVAQQLLIGLVDIALLELRIDLDLKLGFKLRIESLIELRALVLAVVLADVGCRLLHGSPHSSSQ